MSFSLVSIINLSKGLLFQTRTVLKIYDTVAVNFENVLSLIRKKKELSVSGHFRKIIILDYFRMEFDA